jgi:P27 family predicted phage terminase small subunit
MDRVPQAPDWLDDAGQEEWYRVTDEMQRLGTLARADLGVIGQYCNLIAIARNCELELRAKTRQVVFKDKDGNPRHMQQVPLQITYFRAVELALKFAAELGLSPSSRTRVATNTDKGSSDPLAEMAKIMRERRGK